MIELRPMTPAEEAEAVRFVSSYYAEDHLVFNDAVSSGISTLLAHPEWGSLFRILRQTGTVGYICLTYGFDHEIGGRFGTITDFYLEPEFRNAGIGSAALQELLAIAKGLGLNEVGLVVLDHNDRARPFYERHGFQPEHGRAWMWRTLERDPE